MVFQKKVIELEILNKKSHSNSKNMSRNFPDPNFRHFGDFDQVFDEAFGGLPSGFRTMGNNSHQFPPPTTHGPFERRMGLNQTPTRQPLPTFHDSEVKTTSSSSSHVSTPGSSAKNDDSGFEVKLDVRHFMPEELTVKMVDEKIMVEGKHEEKQDALGTVMRHFVRKYDLPQDVDKDKLSSALNEQGMLIIQAPKKAPQPPPGRERTIPVQVQRS